MARINKRKIAAVLTAAMLTVGSTVFADELPEETVLTVEKTVAEANAAENEIKTGENIITTFKAGKDEAEKTEENEQKKKEQCESNETEDSEKKSENQEDKIAEEDEKDKREEDEKEEDEEDKKEEDEKEEEEKDKKEEDEKEEDKTGGNKNEEKNEDKNTQNSAEDKNLKVVTVPITLNVDFYGIIGRHNATVAENPEDINNYGINYDDFEKREVYTFSYELIYDKESKTYRGAKAIEFSFDESVMPQCKRIYTLIGTSPLSGIIKCTSNWRDNDEAYKLTQSIVFDTDCEVTQSQATNLSKGMVYTATVGDWYNWLQIMTVFNECDGNGYQYKNDEDGNQIGRSSMAALKGTAYTADCGSYDGYEYTGYNLLYFSQGQTFYIDNPADVGLTISSTGQLLGESVPYYANRQLGIMYKFKKTGVEEQGNFLAYNWAIGADGKYEYISTEPQVTTPVGKTYNGEVPFIEGYKYVRSNFKTWTTKWVLCTDEQKEEFEYTMNDGVFSFLQQSGFLGMDNYYEATDETAYTLSYDANGGVLAQGRENIFKLYENDVHKVLSAEQAQISREGYIFNGWCLSSDGKGEIYSAGNEFAMPAADTTLYALWKTKTGGGTDDDNKDDDNKDDNDGGGDGGRTGDITKEDKTKEDKTDIPLIFVPEKEIETPKKTEEIIPVEDVTKVTETSEEYVPEDETEKITVPLGDAPSTGDTASIGSLIGVMLAAAVGIYKLSEKRKQ